MCEVLPDVGEYVLGDRRSLMDVVARAVAKGIALPTGGDLYVRVARQYVGLAPSDNVLLSISLRNGTSVEDIACMDVSLPLAEAGDDFGVAAALASTRVLLVVPSVHVARIHTETVKRLGISVESALDANLAHERMRDARRNGAPFDVVYLDDRAPHVTTLLRSPESPANGSRRILATAAAESPLRKAFAAAVHHTLSKPVLPRELSDVIQLLAGASEPSAEHDMGEDENPNESVLRRRSGLRNMRLAAVLASLAVTSARNAR